MPATGIVHLVGAGPGDPGLMTRRSLELVAQADAILYDRLIPANALAGAREECELVYVGKEPGNPALSQEEIGALLVELGQAGKRVVRLKGGDPFVFGRGGEEAEVLAAAEVPFEVVPGVTAGVAAPAYAGIPVTHRDAASAVAFVTGHEAAATDSMHDSADRDPNDRASDLQGESDAGAESPHAGLDWPALAAFPGTLVFYMGVRNLPLIADSLIAAGRDPAQPAAVVRRGTLPDQRTVSGRLEDIAERVAEAGLKAPAITVVGPAAGLREALAWVERRPLHGRRVAVTRARAQASGLAARLRALGADVVETPSIRIEPRPAEGDVAAAVDRLARRGADRTASNGQNAAARAGSASEVASTGGGASGGGGGSAAAGASAAGGTSADPYSLVCLTSANGVELLFEALAARGLDARALAGATVAAIGPGTARALERHGVSADVVPPRSIAESLVEALAEVAVEGRRVLVARAAEARDVLPDALRERGATVDVVALYETKVEPLSDDARAALARADYVTFTSASTARNLLSALGEHGAGADALAAARVVSIGPVTSAAARELGLAVDVEAERHDLDGLVEALVADAARDEAGPAR